MKIIDRKRIGPLLLVMSLAVVGSVMLLMAVTSHSETVSAQQPLFACRGTPGG